MSLSLSPAISGNYPNQINWLGFSPRIGALHWGWDLDCRVGVPNIGLASFGDGVYRPIGLNFLIDIDTIYSISA
jgi:hypothetical protein